MDVRTTIKQYILIYQQACNKHNSVRNTYIPQKMMPNNHKEYGDSVIWYTKTCSSNFTLGEIRLNWL